MPSPAYDCIIVGGGISGFFCGLELQKKHPDWSIAIFEKYKGVGGRTYSYSPPGFKEVRWEMGAGRICNCMTKTIGLVKKFGLHLSPIPSSQVFIEKNGDAPIKNEFSSLIELFIKPLQHLPHDVLASHTLFELMKSVYGKKEAKEIFAQFPYWGEVYSLRADLALKTFIGGEMSHTHGYNVVVEGFGELIKRMREAFERAGGEVLVRMTLKEVMRGEGSCTDCIFDFEDGLIKLRAKKACILALHCDALRRVQGVSELPVLKKLKTAPLFRVYAIFPTNPCWFEGMEHTVTSERPRYIIPINSKKGVIMISYTDGADTEDYHKVYEAKGDKGLQEVVMKDIRRLFPDKKIPEPLFFKGHYWDTGCTYWQSGKYDVISESKMATRPLISKMPSLYMCGESFSLRQAWVEGAIEHSELVVKLLE